jgi:hypothetical protein
VSVLVAISSLCAALRDFDPSLLTGDDCATVAEQLARAEKMCAAARAGAAARAAECRAHASRGFTDATEWLARAMGTSVSEARAAFDTAKAVASCPATKAAWAEGELSAGQAREIAATEAQCPGSEADLIELAKQSSFAALRDAARQRRLDADDPATLAERQRAAQAFCHWIDELGMVRFRGALPPVIGVPFANRLDAETDRLRRQARRAGNDEPRHVHAADAFAAMLAGKGKGRARSADAVFVCDLNAFRRGRAEAGEVCHLIGGGPVPVSAVRDALDDDAFVKAVLHDGVEIQRVKHFGRYLPAELRTALEAGPAPTFQGLTCILPGCGRKYGLEFDHVEPVADGGLTSLQNLKPRCWPHHREKSELERLARRVTRRARADHDRSPP